MLARYIDDPEEDVLTPGDILCWQTTRSQPGDDERIIRTELKEMWQKVADRVAETTQESTRSRFESDSASLVGFARLDARVKVLHIKREQQLQRLDHYRKRLLTTGRTVEELEQLERDAGGVGVTLQEVKEKYRNQWHDERCFVEAACRVHRLNSQLQTARNQLGPKTAEPLPAPIEIEVFLHKTANAVSSALSRARGKLGDDWWIP
jgi:hypothetical protein